jgi:hypothetical protein
MKMKTPKISKLEAVAVVAIMCLMVIPTVSAIPRNSEPVTALGAIELEQEDDELYKEELKETQRPEYQDPRPEPEFDISIDGDPHDATFWQALSNFPEFDDFGSIPLFSLIIPSGIYRLEDPNDPDGPLALYGAQIWVFIRYSLFSGHNAYINGTMTCHMSSGGDYEHEIYIGIDWEQWSPWTFPVWAYLSHF